MAIFNDDVALADPSYFGNPLMKTSHIDQLTRKDLVTRHLTKKLLEYSTGRIMRLKDRKELESTFVAVKARGSGLRDLVHAVVQSKVFLKK